MTQPSARPGLVGRLLRMLGIGRRDRVKQAERAGEHPAQAVSSVELLSTDQAGDPAHEKSRERGAKTVAQEPRPSDQDAEPEPSGTSGAPSRIQAERTSPATQGAAGNGGAVQAEESRDETRDRSPDEEGTTGEDSTLAAPIAVRGLCDERDEESQSARHRGMSKDPPDGPAAQTGSGPDGAEPASAGGPSDEEAAEAEAGRSAPREPETAGRCSVAPSPGAKPPVVAAGGSAAGASSEADGGRDTRKDPVEAYLPRAEAHAEQEHQAGGGRQADPRAQEPLAVPSVATGQTSSSNDRPGGSGLPHAAEDVETSQGDPRLGIRITPGSGSEASTDPAVGSGRDPDPAEPQVTALVPFPSGPTKAAEESTRTPTPTPSPEPTTGPHDDSTGTAPATLATGGSMAGPAGEASWGSGVKDGATDGAELGGSDPEAVRSTHDTAHEEQSPGRSPTWAQDKSGVRPPPTEKAAISGAVALEQAARRAAESSQQAALVERVEGEGQISQASARDPMLADGTKNADPAAGERPVSTTPTISGASVDGVVRSEPSTIKRLRATAVGEHSETAVTPDGFGTPDQAIGQAEDEPHKRATARYVRSEGPEEAPPSLEPGVEEIVRRLGTPLPHPSGDPSTSGTSSADARTVSATTEDVLGANAAHGTTETGAAHPQDENMSRARAASELGRAGVGPRMSGQRQRRSTVSRETVGLEETADRLGGDVVMEDEAAIAVREAALRAAAQVNGTSEAGQQDGAAMDSQDHVSRETLASQTNVDEGEVQPGMATGPTPTGPGAPQGIDSEQAARDARVTFRITRGGYSRFAVAVANQKGGVGKSTTAVNLGAYLALAGARVLVVDLDPQGNASTGLGLDHRRLEPSLYDVLTGEVDAASAIRQTSVGNLDVLPSTIDLAGAEVELVNALSRETRLRQALGAVRYGYDLVFIDCPPSLGLLTVNALAAADELLIPIQCEYYALEGLGQLLRNVELVRVNLNSGLHIGGIVLTMYDGRTRLAEQVVQEVRKHFSDLVYQTVVPRSVRLSEAPGYGVPIALYDPLSRGGIAYRDLALELADRTGLLAPTQEGAS